MSKLKNVILACVLTGGCLTANATVNIDRTRVVFVSEGDKASTVLNLKNYSETEPYLAQTWITDTNGRKENLPLTVVPPIQRMEPGSQSVVTLKALPAAKKLPQDRETLFMFNVRGIPPKVKEANVLLIALQTEVKLFFRPASLKKLAKEMGHPWQEKTIFRIKDKQLEAVNPTPFYVVLLTARPSVKGAEISAFKSVTIAPYASEVIGGNAGLYGAGPVFTYINDWGGRVDMQYRCDGTSCTIDSKKA